MRLKLACLLLIWVLGSAVGLEAGSARIIKVLPHYLDLQGRAALSPSLYERDAYQAILRQHPEQRSALRFDVNWKAKGGGSDKLLLRLELRSSTGNPAHPIVVERLVKPPHLFSTWSSLVLAGEEYRNFGQLIAWRATLWRGDQMVAEDKSFLW